MLAVGILTASLAGHAWAVISLSVSLTDRKAGESYQQTQDDPCIFGNSDCKSSTGWNFADTPTGNFKGDNYLTNLWSFSTQTATDGNNDGAIQTAHVWTGADYKGNGSFTYYAWDQLFGALGCDPTTDTTCGFFIGFDNNRTGEYQVLIRFDIWECTGTPSTIASPNCSELAWLGDGTDQTINLIQNVGTGWTDYIFTGSNLWFSKDKNYAFNLVYT